jgi:hypothetical protein
MARTSSGGTGALVAAILFLISTVVVGVLAIMFYLQSNDAKEQAKVAQNQLNQVASTAEQERLRTLLPPDASGTIAKQAADELVAAKLLVTANAEKPAALIRQQLEAQGLAQDENFETFIQRMLAEVRSDKTEIANLNTQIESLNEQLASMVKQNQALLAQTTTAINNLSQGFEARQREFAQTQQNKDESITQINEQLVSVRASTRGEVAELNRTIEAHLARIAELQRRLDDLQKPETRRTSDVRPELLPDGNIVSVLEKEGMVYINRGRKDRISPGLTFEVYDRLAGISIDENGEQRGKATIEVVNVTSDNASIARVVRRSNGGSLVEGDVISNVVYDPEMVLSFHVVGEFDLDRSGSTSRGDRRRVESMVEQWGGKVVPELTYNTDFLVLGPPPELPEQLDADEIDTQKIREFEEATVRYETYQQLVLKANELRIPVLNQNRFLVLVGYYRR